jgi:hypothetical protein
MNQTKRNRNLGGIFYDFYILKAVAQFVFIITLLLLAGWYSLYSQPSPKPHALSGKRVGVYVSLRNFQYTEAFNQLLAGYVKQSDTLGLAEESMRRAVVIRAGNQLILHLERDVKVSQALYLNAIPSVAQDFISNEKYKAIPYGDLVELNLDYILIWDEARLESETKPAIRTYSNQIFTISNRIDRVLMRWRVVDVHKRQIISQLTVNYESDKPTDLPTYMPAPTGETAAERLFRRAWNTTLALMDLSWP